MAYAAAKAGVVQLTRDLGVHLARSNVRVNAVLFGPIETPQQRAILALLPRIAHEMTGLDPESPKFTTGYAEPLARLVRHLKD